MHDVDLEVRRYLAELSPGFWCWSQDGEAVLWSDGTLLAFRKEVAEVLHAMVSDGLPSFSAVLLVMAASKASWGDGQRAVSSLSSLAGEFAVQRRVVPGALISEVLVGLASLHASWEQLKDDPLLMAELPPLILSDVEPRLEPSLSAVIHQRLRGGPSQMILAPRVGVDAFNGLLDALAALRERLGEVSTDALKLRATTGLDEVVTPADLPVELEPASARGRKLIEALRRDEEYAPLGRLARDLMAAFHLPRFIGAPDDMPLGGVSDISNRGHLDRLLVSELAHDDLTLSVRVATNEALYLRREDPPSTPSRQRHVLLDIGLRMWGVPRVLGAALGLALCASADKDNARTWSFIDAQLREVMLLDRAGLVEHLGRLDTNLSLTEQLSEFAALIGDAGADVVIITSSAAAAEPVFQRAARQLLPNRVYVAGVGREGDVRLLGVSGSGVKQIAAVRMNIDDVAGAGESSRPLIDPNIDSQLPAFLKLSRPPLLLPHAIDARQVWKVDGGPTLSLANDGRLMLWRPGRGGLELASCSPRSQLHWCTVRSGPITQAIIGSLGRSSLQLLTINLDELRVESVELELATEKHIHGVTVHDGHVLVFYQSDVEALDMSSGRVVANSARVEPKIDATWGRIARLGSRWCAASCDGHDVTLHEVARGHEIIACCESTAIEGPILLDDRGYITQAGDDAQPKVRLHVGYESNLQLLAVSRDGRRIAVRHTVAAHNRMRTIFDLSPDRITTLDKAAADFWPLLERDAIKDIVSLSLRVHLDGAFVERSTSTGQPQLGFTTRKSDLALTPWTFLQATQSNRLTLKMSPRRAGHIPFERIPSPAGVGYTLKAAVWPDGSRIVLDSRGLVHLQPASRVIPEATLVLYDAHVSGWVSDGRTWGDAYFTDNDRGADELAIYREVIEPFLRNLP